MAVRKKEDETKKVITHRKLLLTAQELTVSPTKSALWGGSEIKFTAEGFSISSQFSGGNGWKMTRL